MTKITQLKGSCHCGNVELYFLTNKLISQMPTRSCSCTFCTKQAARYISDPQGQLKIIIADSQWITYYKHGTETADFLICTNCGVFLGALSIINEQLDGVLNINTLEDIEHFTQKDCLANYDGETTSQRLERRKSSWIAKVKVSSKKND